MRKFKRISTAFASLLVAVGCSLGVVGNAFAGSFSVSPMDEKIALTPGETYYGSLMVHNPGTSTEDFTFETEVAPFTNNAETDNVKMEAYKNYSMMTDWITILDGEGTLAPNESQDIHYIINVPLDAPGGGQYASILVRSANGETVEGAINIQQQMQIAYLIYAEIAGETVHAGTVSSADVPGFLLSGNISGTATITNNGNVHETATMKLQVFPLFSNEEVYTNEEEPDTTLVMPEATQVRSTTWDNTPNIGIFNVKYTVEFNGETTTVEKMVIKCPIWLLFVIIFAIVALVVWLVLKSKSRKKANR